MRELQDAGVTIQPMQRVETDKSAHKRRDNKLVKALLKNHLGDPVTMVHENGRVSQEVWKCDLP